MHVLRNPVFPVTTMPLTPLDAWIPFVPQALAIYLSLWFYVGIPAVTLYPLGFIALGVQLKVGTLPLPLSSQPLTACAGVTAVLSLVAAV